MANTTADKLALAAQNKAAIKAAISAKNPATAPTNVMSQWPTAIASIPSGGEPEYPHPWKNDGKTHIWWYFGSNTYPRAYFVAQFISAGHTFTVDWGDGKSDTIAASTAYTGRALAHNYAEGGEYEVVISGYDSIAVVQSCAFGQQASADNINTISGASLRQIEIGGTTSASWTGSYSCGIGAIAVKYGDSITSIGNYTFCGCASLAEIDLSNVTTFGNCAFQGCKSLTEVNLSNATTLGSLMFRECTSLTSVGSLENLEVDGSSSGGAFYDCWALREVGDMPKLVTTNRFFFHNCTSLVSVGDMPLVTTLNTAFSAARSLVSIGDMSSLTTITGSSFSSCDSLASLTFRNKTHTEVEAITGFTFFPNRGTALVFHCSDGDYYRSGTSLLPMPT